MYVDLSNKIELYLVAHIEYVLSNIVVHIDSTKAFIPGGHNGPYMNPETPIRNTCHIVVYLSNLCTYEVDVEKQERYIKVLNKLFRYLTQDNPYFIGGQYVFRSLSNDSCNGVIGDAWALEALCINESLLSKDNLNSKNKVVGDILARLKFDKTYRFAYRYDAIKGVMSADFTYNHQLWLAASLCDLESNSAKQFVENFLEYSESRALKTNDAGLIYHVFNGLSIKNIINRILYYRATKKSAIKVDYKERGYHLFNLFAFARLKRKYPEHKVFKSKSFKSALSYVSKKSMLRLFEEKNIYSVSYNVTAFELPFIFKEFSDYKNMLINENDLNSIVLPELEFLWSKESNAFTNNSVDPITFIARVYELSYVLNK